MSAAQPPSEVREALATLDAYVRGGLSLDELIEWAEQLDVAPTADVWLQHVRSELANPLLCREQAMALVREYLRARRHE